MLITSAPLSAAQMMPEATPYVLPEPYSLSTLTGRIWTPGAAPAIPSRLFASAAIIPATWLPW